MKKIIKSISIFRCCDLIEYSAHGYKRYVAKYEIIVHSKDHRWAEHACDCLSKEVEHE